MLNQSVIKTETGATRKTILVDELNSTAFSCKVANTGVEADADGRKILKAGTPLAGSLEARNIAFVKDTESTEAEATATVIATGVTAATVNAETFATKVSESGTYDFIYDADAEAQTPDPSWKLGTSKVTLSEYGVEVTGTAQDGDKVSIAFVAASAGSSAVGILLHDVDVTDGTKNAQIVVFGFIDLNKLDADVQELITSSVKSDLNMIKFVK